MKCYASSPAPSPSTGSPHPAKQLFPDQFAILRAMPRGTVEAPTLMAVPKLASCQFWRVSTECSSLFGVCVTGDSALTRYLTLLPSPRVSDNTASLLSATAKVWIALICFDTVVALTALE